MGQPMGLDATPLKHATPEEEKAARLTCAEIVLAKYWTEKYRNRQLLRVLQALGLDC